MNIAWRNPHARGDWNAGALLSADPIFRECADDLDIGNVTDRIATAFPAVDPSFGVEPMNVWYIPGKSLLVVYRVNRGHDVAPDGDTLITLRFVPAREGVSVTASRFPDDRGLPQLRVLLDEACRTTRLTGAGSLRVLSYLPERRCTVRHPSVRDGEPIVLRVQTPDAASRSHALALAAWYAKSRRFLMPRPLAYDSRNGAFWESFVPGVGLDVLLGTNRFADALTEVVSAVARLHTLRVPNLPAEGIGEIVARTVHKVVPKAAAVFPQLRSDLDRFSTLLTTRAAGLECATPVTLHGDLHTANFLIDDDGVAFIDLDRMASGSPAFDLALLGTRLLLVALDRRCALPGVARTVFSLPELYFDVGGRAIHPDTFAWYVAALLVGRQVKTVIRHLAPNGTELVPTLVKCALQILEGDVEGRCVFETANQASADDPQPSV